MSKLVKFNNTLPLIKNYICPSIKSFQLPLIDIQIIDTLKRQELTLPEINKSKEVYDPLLGFQIHKNLPGSSNKNSIHCGKPLFNELKWRRRKMNIKKRKKYQKKMYYVIQKRIQNKEKRYNNLLDIFKEVTNKKVDLFDPKRFVLRELEKAKFYGYKCSPIYDQYRNLISSNLKTFDETYFRKFDDVKKPIHLKYEEELQNKIK